MTNERDIERLLDHWFSDGPTRVPDRVLVSVADRIERQPQQPAWRTRLWKVPTANPPLRLLVATAALITVVVGGAIRFGGSSFALPTSKPTPSPTPTPIGLISPTESLAPGTYVFTLNGGRTTFTVPAGWRVPTLGPLDFALSPVGSGEDTIRIFFDMRIAAKDEGCSEQPEPGIGVTASAIVADLATHPGLTISTPNLITIGGLDGLVVDVALDPDWTHACPFAPDQPSVPMIVDTVAGEGPFWGIGGNERERLIVLDRPSRSNVVMVIDSINGSTLDDLVADAMPVLRSFRFD